MAKRKLRERNKRKTVHSDSGIDGLAVRKAIGVAEKKGLYLLFQDNYWVIYDKAKGNQIGVYFPSSNMFGHKSDKPSPCKGWLHALDIAKSKIKRGSK